MADELSQETRIKSGVPQGSVIGPLPSEYHQCDNTAFRRRRRNCLNTRTKRPFAELLLQRLELVSKLGPPYQSHQMQLLGGLPHFNYPLPLEARAIPYRSVTLLKAWAFFLTLHPLQRGCLQSKTHVVYEKAVVI